MSKKLTYEFVKSKFKERGFTLLETEYINNSTKMKYLCSFGHENYISYSKLQSGRGCKLCGYENSKKIRSHTNEYVFEYFKSVGCELLNTYVNAKTKLSYICNCGKINKTTWGPFFSAGKRCKECGIKKYNGEKHWKWKEDREVQLKMKKFYNAQFSMLHRCKNRKKIQKNYNDYDNKTLGYTNQELWSYIKNHPHWNNIKDEKWSFDHIFPISAFYNYKIFDTKIINSLDNLQILTHLGNCKKSNKYDKKEFQKWLKTKGVHIEIEENIDEKT